MRNLKLESLDDDGGVKTRVPRRPNCSNISTLVHMRVEPTAQINTVQDGHPLLPL